MPFTICTWNINSVRLRMPIIAQFEVGYHLYPGFPGDMVSVTLMLGVTDF